MTDAAGAPSGPPTGDAVQPPKKKGAHAASVLLCGAVFIAAGAAAAWLAFAKKATLPGPFAGGGRPAPVPSLAGLPSAPSVRIAWRAWGPAAFEEARRTQRLILLDVTSDWSHWSRLMDLGTYGDERVARWVEANALPLRIDRDERPDLARRYGSAVPTTNLLLPTGETLAEGSYASPEAFLSWAERVAGAWKTGRDEILAARERAREDAVRKGERLLGPRRDAEWKSAGPERREQAARQAVRSALEAIGRSEARPRRFPAHGAHRLLAELLRRPLDTGSEVPLRYRSLLSGVARLEDPVWGGLFRYSRCADWTCPEREKLLATQAEAILDAAEAAELGQGASYRDLARRTAAFVEARLRRSPGLYGGALAADVAGPERWIDGDEYYAWDDVRRRSAGLPSRDEAAHAAEHAALATAYFASARGLGEPRLLEAAEAVVGRLEQATSRSGALRRRLDAPGGEEGLLDDQLAAASAALAGYRADAKAKRLELARRWLDYARKTLSDPATSGLRVRRADRPPVPGWTEPVNPDQTAAAALLLDELAQASGAPEDRARAAAALDWVLARADAVDPVARGLVALRYLRPARQRN